MKYYLILCAIYPRLFPGKVYWKILGCEDEHPTIAIARWEEQEEIDYFNTAEILKKALTYNRYKILWYQSVTKEIYDNTLGYRKDKDGQC